MSPRPWRDRVADILEAIDEIHRFIAGMTYEDFLADPKTIKAVTADFAIIGEAANHIEPEIRGTNPLLPWEEMRGMRNIIVHVYHGIDPQIVWDTANNDLPQIVPLLKRMLDEADNESGQS